MTNQNYNDYTKYWQGEGGTGTLHYWWECEMVRVWKTVCRVLKVKHTPTVWHSHTALRLHLGICRREMKACTKIYMCIFIAVLFVVIQKWKQVKCFSTEKWKNKLWHGHSLESYLAIKKELNTNTHSNIRIIMSSKRKQSTYFMISLIYNSRKYTLM